MKFQIKHTNKKGHGLFTLKGFEKDDPILKFNGKTLSTKDMLEKDENFLLLQIGPDRYLDLNNDESLFINHSCNPNAGIKIISNFAFLVAIRKILPKEELTFDYATTSTETPEQWQMNCQCGSFGCRKVVSGMQTIPKDIQEKYLKLGIIPDYVQKVCGL